MITKEEVQSLRKNWLDRSKKHKEKEAETQKFAQQKNGDADGEVKRINRELQQLGKEVQQSLKDYHDACLEYLDAVLKDLDPQTQEEVKREFAKNCNNINDWENAINNLDDLSSFTLKRNHVDDPRMTLE